MTTKRHLPSIEALLDNDDDRLITELCVRELREHVAIARTLLDEVDGLAHGSGKEAAQELAVLGCKIVELANAISRARCNQSKPDALDDFADLSA